MSEMLCDICVLLEPPDVMTSSGFTLECASFQKVGPVSAKELGEWAIPTRLFAPTLAQKKKRETPKSGFPVSVNVSSTDVLLESDQANTYCMIWRLPRALDAGAAILLDRLEFIIRYEHCNRR